MKINVEKCAGLLKDRDNILILCHAHPDGDTLGCGYALLRALQKQGKTVRLECADEIPKKYSYLYDDITVSDFNEEYVIAVDVATENLLGSLEEKYAGRVDLCIDHHGTNTDYAKYLLLNADAAAACEVVLKVIKAMGVEIDKKWLTAFIRELPRIRVVSDIRALPRTLTEVRRNLSTSVRITDISTVLCLKQRLRNWPLWSVLQLREWSFS